MPSYPLEADKLLDTAERLAPMQIGRGRPAYMDHRRAVSTAYYAVYHAVTARVAAIAFPDADTAFQWKVRRWIAHNDVASVARWVSALSQTGGPQPPPHIRTLLAPAGGPSNIDRETALIASGYLELNRRRSDADYDHDAVFTRRDARGQIALASQVASLVENSNTAGVKIFFGLIAMQSRIQAR